MFCQYTSVLYDIGENFETTNRGDKTLHLYELLTKAQMEMPYYFGPQMYLTGFLVIALAPSLRPET